jgi:hypothetical protein
MQLGAFYPFMMNHNEINAKVKVYEYILWFISIFNSHQYRIKIQQLSHEKLNKLWNKPYLWDIHSCHIGIHFITKQQLKQELSWNLFSMSNNDFFYFHISFVLIQISQRSKYIWYWSAIFSWLCNSCFSYFNFSKCAWRV